MYVCFSSKSNIAVYTIIYGDDFIYNYKHTHIVWVNISYAHSLFNLALQSFSVWLAHLIDCAA